MFSRRWCYSTRFWFLCVDSPVRLGVGTLKTVTEKQRVGAEWGEVYLWPLGVPTPGKDGGGTPEVSGGALASQDRQQGTHSSRVLCPIHYLPSLSLPWSLGPILREQPVLATPCATSTFRHLCQQLCPSTAWWTVSSAPTGPMSSPLAPQPPPRSGPSTLKCTLNVLGC